MAISKITRNKIGRLEFEITTLRQQRNLMAKLAADMPQFSSPLIVMEAKRLRDMILGAPP